MMLGRCQKCGEVTTGLETFGVRVFDNKTGRLKRRICAQCAIYTPVKYRKNLVGETKWTFLRHSKPEVGERGEP